MKGFWFWSWKSNEGGRETGKTTEITCSRTKKGLWDPTALGYEVSEFTEKHVMLKMIRIQGRKPKIYKIEVEIFLHMFHIPFSNSHIFVFSRLSSFSTPPPFLSIVTPPHHLDQTGNLKGRCGGGGGRLKWRGKIGRMAWEERRRLSETTRLHRRKNNK